MLVTRDRTSAGDDLDAPHRRRFVVPDEFSWEQRILLVWKSSDLPVISGGLATWALSSNVPLAVMEQGWTAPRMLMQLDLDEVVDVTDGEMRFHWSYFAQVDPEIVLNVLQRLRLRADM